MAFGLNGCTREGIVVVPDEEPSLDSLTVVYGFGRSRHQVIAVPREQWEQVRAVFSPAPTDALEERWRLRWAIALMEQVAGAQTPVHLDLALNETPTPAVGQTDCVDEATNTTRFLRLIEHEGLLRFHRAKVPAFRAHFLLDAHNTATIEELATGIEYVVDSWFKANGELPYVQRLDDWFMKRRWPKEENPKVDPPPLNLGPWTAEAAVPARSSHAQSPIRSGS